MIKKALRTTLTLILIVVFCVAGSGMNIYHFCCKACANQCLEIYFGLTECHDIHEHHHCKDHECHCAHHHHHDADNHDCEHLERHGSDCSLTRISNDETLPTSTLEPPLPHTELLATEILNELLLCSITPSSSVLPLHHYTPPGGREALRDNCILRI